MRGFALIRYINAVKAKPSARGGDLYMLLDGPDTAVFDPSRPRPGRHFQAHHPSLLTLANMLAFQFRFHIAHQAPCHPPLADDRGCVVSWTVEVEAAQDIHI
jgi:hypothetical protein